MVQASDSGLWGLCILCVCRGPSLIQLPPPSTSSLPGGTGDLFRGHGEPGVAPSDPSLHNYTSPPCWLRAVRGPAFSQSSSGKWGLRTPHPHQGRIRGAFQPSCPPSSLSSPFPASGKSLYVFSDGRKQPFPLYGL